MALEIFVYEESNWREIVKYLFNGIKEEMENPFKFNQVLKMSTVSHFINFPLMFCLCG